MKKGEIYIADLNPTQGSEISKKRPVIIFQNEIACNYGNTLTIIPISSKSYKNRVFEVFIPKTHNNKLFCDSKALVNQVRTIDKVRLQKQLGVLDSDMMVELEQKLKLHLEIV